MSWKQGDHVALIGSTGTGKTTLAETLLSQRRYVIALLTKSDTLAWRKFSRATSAGAMDTAKAAADGGVRILLRPPPESREVEFRTAIRKAYKQGGWTVYLDELYELQLLDLEPDIIKIYSEGRSERVTAVGGMQRPSWVTRKGMSRWAISQPTHIVTFQTRDERDLQIIGDIVGRSYASQVRSLKPFTALYLNQATGKMQVISAKDLEGVM